MAAPGTAARGRAPDIAYVLEPRFAGGAACATAAELRVLAGLGRLRVHCRTSALFGPTRDVDPVLLDSFDDLGLKPVWDAAEIRADVAIVHNPEFLKLQPDFAGRLFARHLIVVTHQNFLRPGGAESFDVGACLARIDRAALALRKSLAPVSADNRATVQSWFETHPGARRWDMIAQDWSPICELPRQRATRRPKDRRGRHSSPRMESFPSLAELDLCFPERAEANVILGADPLIAMEVARPHWTVLPFRSIGIEDYFDMVDFMVYFTAPGQRESFARTVAESLAAGKVVLVDAETARNFGEGVVACRPQEVDGIVDRFLADPAAYAAQVKLGQQALDRYSASAFRRGLSGLLEAAAR